MLRLIDDFLNKITMYRLVLYGLTLCILAALVLSIFGKLFFTPLSLIISVTIITAACWAVNKLFSWIFNAPTNVESVYITAFILTLIVTPAQKTDPLSYYLFLVLVAAIAMASKYILAIHKKHIFNPAAIAVVITSITIGQGASWWVGTISMLPFVVIVGLLMGQKIKRWDLSFSYLITALVTIIIFGLLMGTDTVQGVKILLLYSPLVFFASIMLTEPSTTPPTKKLRIVYGILVGVLASPFVHFGSVYLTPELALVIGNIFSYIVSPKQRLVLALKNKIPVAANTFNFVFQNKDKLNFKPGQYLEWTLPHRPSDARGNRRYFTIASSPTEPEIQIGVKFYPNPSTFKQKLSTLKETDTIAASQLAGDFTMPNDTKKKLVFIAGGIGATPFRSMVKYLLDKNEARPITMFFSNNTVDDIPYKDIFDQAGKQPGIKTIYTLTNKDQVPSGWKGKTGFVDGAMIEQEVPDFKERIFYISGAHNMVTAVEDGLKKLGVPRSQIKTDFFPGYV